jgi:hypothetical protein
MDKKHNRVFVSSKGEFRALLEEAREVLDHFATLELSALGGAVGQALAVAEKLKLDGCRYVMVQTDIHRASDKDLPKITIVMDRRKP